MRIGSEISCSRIVFLLNFNKVGILMPSAKHSKAGEEEECRPFAYNMKIKIYRTTILPAALHGWSGNGKRHWSNKIMPVYKIQV
jgi:hypothetical protein